MTHEALTQTEEYPRNLSITLGAGTKSFCETEGWEPTTDSEGLRRNSLMYREWEEAEIGETLDWDIATDMYKRAIEIANENPEWYVRHIYHSYANAE